MPSSSPGGLAGISHFALDNPRFVLLFQVAVIVLGIRTFGDYPRREDPSITIRDATVTASLPGMATARVEELITRKLEEKIRELPEVKHIKSDSKVGQSIVHVTLADRYTQLQPIWQRLRNKVEEVREDLPDGVHGPFVNDEVGLTALATIALWADGFSLAEMHDTARTVRDRLYSLEGVREISLYGVQEERIYLEFSNAKMARLGMSPDVIARTLQQQNIILPGGNLYVEGRRIIVEPSGNFNAVSEIESVVVPLPESEKVASLRDLVEIRRDYVDPPSSPVYFNGRPAIVLSISALEGVNSVEFGQRLTRALKVIEASLPFGYFLEYATYQPALIEKAVNGAISNVYQSLVIVLVVVMLFLGWRTGLIVGSFVPLAMLLGLIVMRVLDVEMQRMSIASMIIALGMLVDNGIVIAEDVRTRMQGGQQRREAALAAGRTLALPLLAASLTTILAFAPISLAEGGTGEYTLSLSQVVIIVLLSSWFLSLFSTTSLCYQFLQVKPGAMNAATGLYDTRFYRAYRAVLERLLRARWAVVVATLLTLAATGYATRFVVEEFFPASDRNQFLVYLDLPAGTHARKTAEETVRLSEWLGDKDRNPEVTGTVAYVGQGGPRFFLALAPLDPDPHVGFLVVNVQSSSQVAPVIERVRQRLLDNFPEARSRVKRMWLGATETGLVKVRLVGKDADLLLDRAERLLTAFRAVPGMLDMRHDWDNRVPKVVVAIDQARARRVGVTSQEVAWALSAYIDGAEVTDYREGDTAIPLVLRGLEEERRYLTRLRSINVYSAATGKSVPLPQIADFQPFNEPSRIKRRDQERTITVSAKHQYLKAGQLFDRIHPALDGLGLPDGYRWELGGELEESKKARSNLYGNMPACFLLIVALLVWQFNSFRKPAIILLTIPLTFIGAVIGLLVMRAEFGFMTLLGLLSLAGIIVNNGIVLIDRIDIERAAGRAPYEAVVSSCVARLRPILMTTLTTILGLMPLIVWHDPLFYSMACVIAFGLAIGTVFTLGVVPVLYAILFRVPSPQVLPDE